MAITPNPPVILPAEALKVWTFVQNADGTLSPGSSGGGGGGGLTPVNITQILSNPAAIGNPLPVELSDGTNPFGTLSNPLNVFVSNQTSSSVTQGSSPWIIGGKDSLGVSRTSSVDINGNLMVAFQGQLLTVFQEMLMEMRATRRLLFLLYEESGEGAPDLLDDPIEPSQTDYN
jgi:hypothetical protein